jgi:hypothetical protein
MPSKKVTISQKIFIFLLITVGIVFILLQVYRSVREGFDTTTIDVNCKLIDHPVNGRQIYMCVSREEALSQLINMKDESFADVAVCYADIRHNDDTNADSNYNFGIGASNLPTVFYTCFDRPAHLQFDASAGIKVPVDDIDDPQPEYGVNTLQTNCAAYNGAFQTYFKNYIKTSSILGSINTIGFSNIASSINVLSNVSSQKCVGSPNNPLYVNRIDSNVCNSINDGISRFINISNDRSSDSLGNLKDVLTESKNLLSNEIYTILKPAFLNSGCDSNITEYMKII